MFAEKTELQLVTDLNETALVELNAADMADVAGGPIPFAVWAAGYYAVVYGPRVAAAAGLVGAGAAVGYYNNR